MSLTIWAAGGRSSTCTPCSGKARARTINWPCSTRARISGQSCSISSGKRSRLRIERPRRKDLMDRHRTDQVVGLLCGREYSFPPAFVQRVNELGAPHGIVGDMVKLGGTKMDEPAR